MKSALPPAGVEMTRLDERVSRITPRDLGRVASAVWRRADRDDLLMLAAAPAYAAVLSVFPLLIAVIALLSLLVDPVTAQNAVVRSLGPYVPEQSLLLVQQTLQSVVRTRGTAGLVGVLGLLWGASAMTGSLRHALNRVIGAPRRAYWRRKLADLVLVLIGGLLLGLSVLWSATLAALPAEPVAVLTRWLGDARVARAVAVAGPGFFSAAAFAVAYRFLPHMRARASSIIASTLVGIILFEALKKAFVSYLRVVTSYPLIYGPLAGFIVFMFWVYLVALVVLFGAEVLTVLERGPEEGLRA